MIASLRCPDCKKSGLKLSTDLESLICMHCACRYEKIWNNAISMLSKNISETKEKIQEFWGDTCKQWYTDFDATLTTEVLNDYLTDLEQMFKYRSHLAVVEMPLKELSGKQILEIGSGGGGTFCTV